MCHETAYIEAHVGPELAQAAAGARSTASTFFAGAVGQGRPAASTVDVTSPQWFQDHPRLVDAVSTTAAGDDTTRESLPGRVSPSVWDGEPGWLSAIGGF